MYCSEEPRTYEQWWLASPSYYRDELVCYVNSENASLSCQNYGTNSKICPMVALKKDFDIEIIAPVDAETISKNPDAYYGQKVNDYTAGGLTYRIFYVDTDGKFGEKNTIYLKADWTANDTSVGNLETVPEGSDLDIYKKLNPDLAEKIVNWGSTECGAAWFGTASNWTKYLDDTKADYAIAAPSI